MANKCKVGLDYFPFDATFFEDDKIQLIHAEYGPKGVLIAIKLLCKIYKEGYYYKWGEDQCLLFSKNAGAEFVPSFVFEVVNGLIRRSFFDKGVFDSFGILTSSGIQRRYFDATGRYKKLTIISEYLLIKAPSRENVHIISINVYTNPKNVDTNPHNGNGSESNNGNGSETVGTTPIIPIHVFDFEPTFQSAPRPAPGIDEVKLFFTQNNQPDLAERFFYRYEGVGWMINSSPITNWRAVAQTWIMNPNKFKTAEIQQHPPKSKLDANIDANHAAKELNRKIHESANKNQ